MAEQREVAIDGAIKTKKIKKRSYISVIWSRFRKNTTAVISLGIIVVLVLIAIFGPMLSKYHYESVDYTALYQGPSSKHWFGTDEGGRDMLTLLMYSLRNALFVGLGAGVIQVFIGLTIGAIAGYFGGKIDNILMRFVDIMYGFPSLLFMIILVMVMGRSLFTIFLAIGLTSWVGMARLVRGQVLTIKQSEFIEAAKAMGASNFEIIFKYIMPNSVGPLIIALSFSIPSAMLAEAGMSMIGLGVMPPMPSWGILLSRGQSFMLSYPYMMLFPAVSFAIVMLSFTYFSDGLRDAFDPRSDK
ncbi:ABC transporter permease [Desnuesiella massiliensis]|uniref:ABC transporter permease n=1 Tax=Desnuesiella massiliensis TaxID=1650662 RepID=UPI0009E8E4E6|nr:ABC transporter permease [Desnuesiella massiliensis]